MILNRLDFEDDLSSERINKRSIIRKIVLKSKPKITSTLFRFNVESETSNNNEKTRIENVKIKKSLHEIRPLSLKKMRETNLNK